MIRNLRHDIVTPKAVEKHLARLKAEGRLRRVGPDKGGHWMVNDHR